MIQLWKTLAWPLTILSLWAALHFAGGRETTTVLSGTAPVGLQSLLGLIYVALWLTSVLLVPPWVAGLLCHAALQRFRRGRDDCQEP